jgi:hypothetical protein
VGGGEELARAPPSQPVSSAGAVETQRAGVVETPTWLQAERPPAAPTSMMAQLAQAESKGRRIDDSFSPFFAPFRVGKPAVSQRSVMASVRSKLQKLTATEFNMLLTTPDDPAKPTRVDDSEVWMFTHNLKEYPLCNPGDSCYENWNLGREKKRRPCKHAPSCKQGKVRRVQAKLKGHRSYSE